MADEPQANGEMPQGEQEQGQGQSEKLVFADWLEAQPESIKNLVGGKVNQLHGELRAARDQRKEFADQLKELLPKAEKGSELERVLNETTTRLEQAEQRAAFYEEAGKPEIGCSNPKAAFLVASAEGLFSRRGEPDWTAIKAAAPELFARKVAPGNAGNGTQAPPVTQGDMNTWIRSAAKGG